MEFIDDVINKAFRNNDEKILSFIFDPLKRESQNYINRINKLDVVDEISKLIRLYKQFIDNPILDNALKVLYNSYILFKMPKVIKQMVKNVLLVLEYDNKKAEFSECILGSSSLENYKKTKEVLFILLNSAKKLPNNLSVYIVNVICMINNRLKNHKESLDTLTTVLPNKKGIDYFIYHFNLGLCFLKFNVLNTAFEEWSVAIRSLKIGNKISNEVFLLLMLENPGIPELTSDDLNFASEKLKYELENTDTTLYSLFYLVKFYKYIIFKPHKSKFDLHCYKLLKSDKHFNLIKLKIVTDSGSFRLSKELIPQLRFTDGFINDFMMTFMPLVCIRNYIIRWNINNNFSNIICIPEIAIKIELSYEELCHKILISFDKNLIKGYINLKKKVLVLCKKNPFPKLLKNDLF